MIARLQPGVTLAQADAQLTCPGRAVGRAERRKAWCPAEAARRTRVRQHRACRLADPGAGGAGAVHLLREPGRPATGAAGGSRSHDRAIRLALGASRTRLMREALAESLLVSLGGWGTGSAAGRLGHPVASAPADLGRGLPGDIRHRLGQPVRPRALLAFTLALVVVVALVVGTVPAWMGASGEGFTRSAPGWSHRGQPCPRPAALGGRGDGDGARSGVAGRRRAVPARVGPAGLFRSGLAFDGLLYARIDRPRPRYPDRATGWRLTSGCRSGCAGCRGWRAAPS